MTVVHVVVPDGIDDPARPSGGNTYDRHVCRELTTLGWTVHEHAVRGGWPYPDKESRAALAGALERISDNALVLLDGLIASTVPDVLVPQASRLRLVVLVHMPLGHRPPENGAHEARTDECAVLSAAAAIVTTSAWTQHRLLELYSLPADRVHVAAPGVNPVELATGAVHGGALLCVAAVTFDKGHDVLLDALEKIADLSWHCVCVGSLDREPVFVERLHQQARRAGIHGRVSFTGPRTGPELNRSYAAADLLVLASRAETYGMVLIEALARGLPVIATDVGGVTEALGYGANQTRPGLLVPPEDPQVLAGALRAWLSDAELRARLRQAARERRESLRGWSSTTSVIARVLAGASG